MLSLRLVPLLRTEVIDLKLTESFHLVTSKPGFEWNVKLKWPCGIYLIAFQPHLKIMTAGQRWNGTPSFLFASTLFPSINHKNTKLISSFSKGFFPVTGT